MVSPPPALRLRPRLGRPATPHHLRAVNCHPCARCNPGRNLFPLVVHQVVRDQSVTPLLHVMATLGTATRERIGLPSTLGTVQRFLRRAVIEVTRPLLDVSTRLCECVVNLYV